MKKNLIVIAGFVITLIGGNKITAQALSSENKMGFKKSVSDFNKTLSPFETNNDNINQRALENFSKTYKDATGEIWSEGKGGFSVTFTTNGQKAHAFYDKKGRWQGIVKYLNTKKLPRELKDIIRSAYYDYNIVYAQEIETMDSQSFPTYIVGLEDDNTIKIIRIGGGEIEVWQQFQKTN